MVGQKHINNEEIGLFMLQKKNKQLEIDEEIFKALEKALDDLEKLENE